jgi:GT2 family glycosyltransferase
MMIGTLSVVSHGHGPLLHRLLRDLCSQEGIEHCLIAVTLNIESEQLDLTEYAQLQVKLIRNASPKGFGANHNAAFEHCQTPQFVVVNPDIRLPDRTALRRLLQSGGTARVGLRAPVVTNSAGLREDSVRGHLTPWSLIKRALGRDRAPLRLTIPAEKGSPFFWLAGMFMVLDSQAFRAVGGFDERFFLYCEDYDLCARLYLSDYSVVLDETVSVIHDAQRDSHRSAKHLRWHLGSLIKVWTSSAFWRVLLHRPT